jgi:maleate isomerase
MSLGFGFKARIGQLYPSGGQCDYEVQMMAPAGVQFLTTRMPFKQSRLEDDIRIVETVEAQAQLCADAKVDLILFNCTAASLVAGPDTINTRIHAATGVRSVTTIEAVLDAMRAAGMHRIALMTAYQPEVVKEEVHFLEARGYTVVAAGGIPCDNPLQQGSIPPAQWLEAAKSLKREIGEKPIDGMLISCAGIQIGAVLQEIEDYMQCPVVASNQAALWKCLRMLEIDARTEGYGRLLAGEFDR